jgi:hypothetical protein
MPAVCGIACEVCVLADKGMCPLGDRCIAGTDPKAPEKLDRFKAATGHTCLILECAINNNVDYCFRCDKFPCETHYQQEIFSHKLLDLIKSMHEKM